MAFMNQERKKELAPAIKAVLKKYKVKGTIAVRHYSSLVVNIKSGELDILGAYKLGALTNRRNDFYDPYDVKRLNYVLEAESIDVNTYWIEETYEKSPVVKEFLLELKEAMEGPEFFNHDDSMTDYFHRSHYIDINVGSYDKPYQYTGSEPIMTFEPVEVIKENEVA